MNVLPLKHPGRLAALTLAAAGAAMLWNRAKARQAERETPPLGNFIDAGGATLHYVREGQGSPIVLLHGNGALIQDWFISGIFAELVSDHEVIAFDRPGFGYSTRRRTRVWTPAAQAKAIAAAIRQLGIGRAVIAGHSFGALVAAKLAIDHPDVVERLVLISGYYYPTLRVDSLLSAPPAMPVIGDVLRNTVSPLLGRAMKPLAYRKLFAPAPVSREWERRFPSGMALRPKQLQGTSADGALMPLTAAEAARGYGQLPMPVTIVAGEGDEIAAPETQAMRLHQEVPHSRLVLVEGAGHMVHHSAPQRVIAAING